MQFIEQKDILNATNGGLDIILQLYPDAAGSVSNPNRKFKTRDEKTASAKLNRTDDDIFLVIDFGSDQQSRNGIGCYALENRCDFITAINELAVRYNVVSAENASNVIKAAYKETPADPDQADGTWAVDTSTRTGWTDFEIETIISKEVLKRNGWFKDDEFKKKAYNIIAAKFLYYYWHPVTSYSIIKNRKVMTFSATDQYPIYLIDEGTHRKLYQPKHPDKSKRFMYVPGEGKKPKDFIHGFAQLQKAYIENMKVVDSEAEDGDDSDGKKKKKKKNYKLESVMLCTGGSDAINAALCGYNVIWMNSESAKLMQYQYDKLNIWVERIYQVSDLDSTGRKQAHILAMQYLDIFNVELPRELMRFRDPRGNPSKDLRDYFNHYSVKDFDLLVKVSMPYRFWERKGSYNRSGEFQGFDYVFDNEQGYNFLQKNGFYRLPVGDKDNDFQFVRIEGNIVKYSNATDIKEYLKNFMRDRYLDKDLRNAIYRSAQLNESSLTNLDKIEIEFSDADKDTQFLFFQNKTLEVTAQGITEHKPGAVERFIWENEVHQHRYEKVEVEPFTITKDAVGGYDIQINSTDCLFLKYLTQTSRMHWRAELEDRLSTSKMSNEERDQYVQDHKYDIAGPLLTPEEIDEQKQHLINKIFTIGYLMHRYKDRSKPWFVFAMDGKLSDDGQSHGGSGKSILYDMAMRTLLKRNFFLSGRNPKLTDDPFKYDGLTEHDRYILVDDAHEYLKLDVFYVDISGDMKVNPKGKTPFTIVFDKTGKFAFTSNYTPRNLGPSTRRRLIYNVFSDYYHNASELTDYKESRDPRMEFGKNMFTEFNQSDFNNFYNTAAHCLRFYLSTSDKVGPAMANVTLRNLTNAMGEDFLGWANVFFSVDGGNVDTKIVRDVAYFDFRHSVPGKWTPNQFWKKLEAFCQLNGYVLNPRKISNNKGKIIEKTERAFYDPKTNTWTAMGGPKVPKELLYVQINDSVNDTIAYDPVNPELEFNVSPEPDFPLQ